MIIYIRKDWKRRAESFSLFSRTSSSFLLLNYFESTYQDDITTIIRTSTGCLLPKQKQRINNYGAIYVYLRLLFFCSFTHTHTHTHWSGIFYVYIYIYSYSLRVASWFFFLLSCMIMLSTNGININTHMHIYWTRDSLFVRSLLFNYCNYIIFLYGI